MVNWRSHSERNRHWKLPCRRCSFFEPLQYIGWDFSYKSLDIRVFFERDWCLNDGMLLGPYHQKSDKHLSDGTSHSFLLCFTLLRQRFLLPFWKVPHCKVSDCLIWQTMAAAVGDLDITNEASIIGRRGGRFSVTCRRAIVVLTSRAGVRLSTSK